MSTELIATLGVGVTMIGVGVTIVGVILNGQRSQRADIKDLRKEMQEQGEKHSKEITEVKVEVAALKATVDTYFRVRVDPPLQSAVAETPEDYDAD